MRLSLWLAAALVLALPAGAQPLKVALEFDPAPLDPATDGSYTNRVVTTVMCDSLIDLTPDLQFVPLLATGWEWGADRLSLTVKLRPGVNFQDGAPFDAAAMVANIVRYKTLSDPIRKAEVAARLLRILPREAVLHSTEDTRPYECDGLAAYRQLPMVVALPSNEDEVAAALRICLTLSSTSLRLRSFNRNCSMAGVACSSVTGWLRELTRTMTWAPLGEGCSTAWPSCRRAKLSRLARGSCSAARTAWLPANLKSLALR